jgi:hypothetical protein
MGTWGVCLTGCSHALSRGSPWEEDGSRRHSVLEWHQFVHTGLASCHYSTRDGCIAADWLHSDRARFPGGVSGAAWGRFTFWPWHPQRDRAFNTPVGGDRWGDVGRGWASSEAEIRSRGAGTLSEAKTCSRGARLSSEAEIGLRAVRTLERGGNLLRGCRPLSDGPEWLLGRNRRGPCACLFIVNPWGVFRCGFALRGWFSP